MVEQTVAAQITTDSDGPSDSRPNTPESELESPVVPSPLRFVHPEILETLEHLRLSSDVISKESRVIGLGTFGDVTRALCTHPERGRIKVAIKRLRFCDVEDFTMVGASLQ